MSLLQIWILVLFLKIALLPFLPITPDEAYYFDWSRHLQLSYFDHPPFISWIMLLAQPFWKTPFGVRLPGVVLGHLGLLPWFAVLKNLKFNSQALMFWFLLMILGPLTGIGGFIVTPDLPLMIFWGLAIWVLQKAVAQKGFFLWLLLGAIFGLGLLSKYTMILFPIAALVWIFWDGKEKVLRSWKPWVGMCVSILVFLPVFIWNYKNHFASVGFQFQHGLGGSGLTLKWIFEYLAGQFGLINPIVSVLAIMAAVKFAKTRKFLIVFAGTPLVFFLLSSFRSHVEPNWPVCAYPAATALAVLWLMEKKSATYQVWLKGAVALSVVFFVTVISQTVHPWLPLKKDHTEMLRRWKNDIVPLQDYQPLYARSYQLAAYYSYFRLPEREVFKPAGLDRVDFYDFLPQPQSLAPNYIVLEKTDVMPEWFQQKYRLKELQTLPSGFVLYQILSL